MADTKGKPKRDGSGQGTRENEGRGGCETTESTGQGRVSGPPGRGRNRRIL